VDKAAGPRLECRLPDAQVTLWQDNIAVDAYLLQIPKEAA